MRINKKVILLSVAVLSLLLGCSDQQTKKESKRDVDTNQTAGKTTISKELVKQVESPLFTINNKAYGLDSLPEGYRNFSGKKRKFILDNYINYKLVLDSLDEKRKEYHDEIEKKIQKEKDWITMHGSTESVISQMLRFQKIELRLIAYKEVAKQYSTLEKEMRDYYESHQDLFKYTNTVEASIIVLEDLNNSKKILKELKLKKESVTAQRFGQFAKKYSISTSRIKGGYTGFISEKSIDKELFSKIWKESTHGLIDQIIEKKTNNKKRYVILYIHDKKESGIEDFEGARDTIMEHLLLEEKNKWIKKRHFLIRKKIKVEIYDSFEENLTL
jgi:hypothetical protein